MPFERMRGHALVDFVVRNLHFAGKLNVVVCKFADLDVVDAREFFFFGGAETKRGDVFAEEVEGAEDEARADEGVGAAGEGVGELIADLDPVPV
jgi:hypothetical protein